MFTGYSERISEMKAREIGVREFILKPVVISEIAEVVRRVLDDTRDDDAL
jgi:DNA-binding response OmpR family regulator